MTHLSLGKATAFLLRSSLLWGCVIGASVWSQQVPKDQSGTLPTRTGRLEGKVLSRTDAKPLAGATVRLRRETAVQGRPDPNAADYTTQADAEGAYVFPEVEPGIYRVYADIPGFVRRFYGAQHDGPSSGVAITVEPGTRMRSLDLELLSQGSISGRVENEDRTPAAGVLVAALGIGYKGDKRFFFPLQSAGTNGDGGYAIRGLPPGKYYVRVEQNADLRVAGDSREHQRKALPRMIQPTYFPKTESIDTAIVLEVGAGKDLRGIDLRVKTVEMFQVCGTVDWAASGGPAPLVLALVTTAFDTWATVHPNFSKVRSDHKFCFEEVLPGTYYLEPARTFIKASENMAVAGRMDVEVRDRNIGDLEFVAMPPIDYTGSIRLERSSRNERNEAQAIAGVAAPGVTGSNSRRLTAEAGKGAPVPPPPPVETPRPASPSGADTPSPSNLRPSGDTAPTSTPAAASASQPQAQSGGGSELAGIQIQLVAVERLSVNAPRALSEGDGSFRLSKVPMGRYRPVVSNLPEGFYVKSILFGGQDVSRTELSAMSGAGGELVIHLADEAVELTGSVRGEKDRPVAGARVSVWSEDRSAPGIDFAVQTASTDLTGSFRVSNLAPGRYRIVAWDETVGWDLAASARLCRTFERDGVAITRDRSGGGQSIQLKPVVSERIRAAGW